MPVRLNPQKGYGNRRAIPCRSLEKATSLYFLAIYELSEARENQKDRVEKPHFGLFPSLACVICITN